MFEYLVQEEGLWLCFSFKPKYIPVMPYAWTHTPEASRLEAWPYRSLPKTGFAVVIGIAYGLIVLPLLAVLGTVALWGLLPFSIAAVAALWWGLQRSYRDGEILEELVITEDTLSLKRSHPREPVKEFSCNPYWASVEMHLTGGPVPHYITIKGSNREVEIGAFLSEDERRRLYGDLSEILMQARTR